MQHSKTGRGLARVTDIFAYAALTTRARWLSVLVSLDDISVLLSIRFFAERHQLLSVPQKGGKADIAGRSELGQNAKNSN